MVGRILVISAIVCYLAVVGCVMMPDGRPSSSLYASGGDTGIATRPTVNPGDLPFRGVAMQLQRVDWMDRYKQNIDEVAALGADTVSLVVDSRQENGSSSRIYLDQRITPSADQLMDLVKHAKSKKLRVVMMPIVLLDEPRGSEWRGTLKPDVWEDWFTSYRAMITHFAWVAQSSGVDVLVVGSELVSSENKAEQWARVIRDVRRIYKGRITYSSNWDHYTSIPFWKDLDLMGMNSYYKLGNDRNVSVDEITQRWADIQKDLLAFARKIDKPILMLEAGWCSLANAAHEPWDYTQVDVSIDLELQQKLYEGYFRSWQGNPQLGGFMIWEWPPGDGGPQDRGYTPENKPAEKVLKEWFAKPWR